MGMIEITTRGSFGFATEIISAQASGHAVAVDDAMKYLQKLSAKSKEQDKKLRSEGLAPDDEFAEADKRGLLAGEYRRMTPEEYAKCYASLPAHRAEAAMSVKYCRDSMEVAVFLLVAD